MLGAGDILVKEKVTVLPSICSESMGDKDNKQVNK